jgi:hypothetical protein
MTSQGPLGRVDRLQCRPRSREVLAQLDRHEIRRRLSANPAGSSSIGTGPADVVPSPLAPLITPSLSSAEHRGRHPSFTRQN